MCDVVGRIFNIGRYAVHDGPGIRTTIFFKGCPMRCIWCCSPQSQNFNVELSVDDGKVFGYDVTVRELFDKVWRDSHFWRKSGGGVTLSGGEVLSQPDFAIAFLDLCRSYNIHTAIETCLCAPPNVALNVAECADFIIFDLKAIDVELHKKLTSCGNEQILENAAAILRSRKPALARFPLIPGVNDSEDNLRALGAFLESGRKWVDLEILKYHRMGVGLYEQLGRTYALQETEPPTDEEFDRVKSIFSEYMIQVF